jgi:hypothetical protein
MRIRVLGGGWYGCTIADHLISLGHDVSLHESKLQLFAGASGGNPARLHLGFHYPRSGATIKACLDHHAEFMDRYGFLTRGVPTNIYAVAAEQSLVDYQQYVHAFAGRIQFIEVEPATYGLVNVEGAVLTGERHIVIEEARAHFEKKLAGHIKFNDKPLLIDDPDYALTIDCTFCANDAENIDRFEPCVTALLFGPTEKAVTIMDGPFGSIYPWNETHGLSSLTSASLTPITKTCREYAKARQMLDALNARDVIERGEAMMNQMAHYWPACRDLYRIVDFKLSIRAMPKSAADTRLVDVVRVGQRALRVRAGKIDAVFHAAREIENFIKWGIK